MQAIYESPIGQILLETSTSVDGTEALSGLYFTEDSRITTRIGREGACPLRLQPVNDITGSLILAQCARELDEYFAGTRKTFDVPFMLRGTPFRETVWAELERIPYGEAISYAELATRVGNPKASRAVGSANGQNPISLIIPCHRVITSSGTLGGYAGGLSRKEWLLAHEGIQIRK